MWVVHSLRAAQLLSCSTSVSRQPITTHHVDGHVHRPPNRYATPPRPVLTLTASRASSSALRPLARTSPRHDRRYLRCRRY